MLSIRKPLAALLPVALLAAPAAVRALPFGMGPVLGAESADADIDGHGETDGRFGLALGLRAEFGVKDPWSLLIEPQYVQKGSRFDAFGLEAKGELDYLEIPVLAKFEIWEIRNMWTHFYAFAGPSLGINLKAEGRLVNFTDFAADFEKQTAKLSFSGDIGLGVAYEMRHLVFLNADVRYSHGFTDALDKQVGDIGSWYSRDVRLLLGLIFQFSE